MAYFKDMDCEKSGDSNCSSIVDIDSKLKDPQACIPYATDIYKNAHILEVCTAIVALTELDTDSVMLHVVLGTFLFSSLRYNYRYCC